MWLLGYLEPRVPGWCVLGWCGYLDTLNLVPAGSCPLLVWLSACLEPRALVVGRLVVGGYLYALNLVPCWFVSLVEVVTCMP